MITLTKTMSVIIDHGNGNDVMLREPCSDLGTCSPSRSPPKNCYSTNRGELSPKSYTRLFSEVLYFLYVLLYILQSALLYFWYFIVVFQIPSFSFDPGFLQFSNLYYLSLFISYQWLQVRPYLIPDSNDLIRQVGKWLCMSRSFGFKNNFSPASEAGAQRKSSPCLLLPKVNPSHWNSYQCSVLDFSHFYSACQLTCRFVWSFDWCGPTTRHCNNLEFQEPCLFLCT